MSMLDRLRGMIRRSPAPQNPQPQVGDPQYLSNRLGEMKAAYAAAKTSRFRRLRTRLGGTADAHYSSASDFYQIREYCRDMDRNDAVVGQMIDRAVDNIIGQGFDPIPNTGDAELDDEIIARWNEWSNNPFACDVAWRMSFRQMQRLALRHTFVDGDVFAVLTGSGAIQMLEGDMVDSPSSFSDDIVHGVEVDTVGRPLRYWIRQLREGERERTGRRAVSEQDFAKRSAFFPDGTPAILQVFNPKRLTQTRGVSVFAPVFDVTGMFEDATFAKLVQQQITSCVAMFIERETDFKFGDREEVTWDSNTHVLEEIAPGLVVRGRPGEKMNGFTPNVTPSDWFDHIKLLLRMIGANVGLPLSLVLLDTSDTTFHGYRGELAQAQMGFACMQAHMIERFHSPVYRWKVREWFPDRVARSSRTLAHRFGTPGWPYVDPMKDAQADALALENMLMSPREQQARRGMNWETTVRETVADRKLAITAAMQASAEIEAETGNVVPWRDILNQSTPGGVSISTQVDATDAAQEREAG